jgi:hypothetical protein
MISGEDVAAEDAFRLLCERYGTGTIGVWHERPVRFDLLLPALPAPSISPELIARLKWAPNSYTESTRQLIDERNEQMRRRLLAYAGYVTFHSDYQKEKEALRAMWRALSCRPAFPLVANVHDQLPRPVPDTTCSVVEPLPDNVVRLLQAVGTCLRKWQLNRLVTWDLPVPQGPLVDLPLRTALRLLGPDQIVSTIPAFYDLPARENEREARQSQQQFVARQAGLEGTFPISGLGGRGADPSTEESAYRLWVLENSVRSRYGSPRGMVSRLVAAFCTLLGCEENRVKQLRRLYLPFLHDAQESA